MRLMDVSSRVMALVIVAVALGTAGTVGSASAQCIAPTPDYQWNCRTNQPATFASSVSHTVPIPDFRWTGKDLQDMGRPGAPPVVATDHMLRTLLGLPPKG